MPREKVVVGSGPEHKVVKGGTPMCSFESTDGQRYVAFGQKANTLAEFATVGDEIEVNGYYKTYHWEDYMGAHSREDFIIKSWWRI